MTSWHSEIDFLEHFNSLSENLKDIFPKVECISNWDIPEKRIEHFDIYIRGVGSNEAQDS